MEHRSKLAGLRLGMTWGAGLVLLALVIAMLSAPTTAKTTAPYFLGATSSYLLRSVQ